MCEDMTLCTDLARRHVVDEIARFCHCSVQKQLLYFSKYFLGKRCFLRSNMRSNIGQNLAKLTRPSNATRAN